MKKAIIDIDGILWNMDTAWEKEIKKIIVDFELRLNNIEKFAKLQKGVKK